MRALRWMIWLADEVLRWMVWLADEVLDRVPAYEDGRWYRHGQWGCRLGLHRFWWPGDEASRLPGATTGRG